MDDQYNLLGPILCAGSMLFGLFLYYRERRRRSSSPINTSDLYENNTKRIQINIFNSENTSTNSIETKTLEPKPFIENKEKNLEASKFKQKGDLFFQQHRFNDAVQAYTSGLLCSSKHVKCLCNRSLCYIELGDYYKALKDSERCIRYEPEYTKGWYHQGIALFKLKRYHAALQCFEKVIYLDPNYKNASKKIDQCKTLLNLEEKQEKSK